MAAWNLLEGIGLLSGIAGVWLTARHTVWCYPVGILNVCISAWIFMHQNLYADALQQVMYFILLIYGWLSWSGIVKVVHREHITISTRTEQINLVLATLVGGGILGFALKQFTQAAYPWTDSLATAAAFSAQYLVARRKLSNWLWWIPVNLTYLVIYWQKGLILYAALSFIYLALAIHGYKTWKHQMKFQQ
jgi:nicotinamide mononucleotide transporter